MTRKTSPELAKADKALKSLKSRYALVVTEREMDVYGDEFTLQNEVAGIKIRHSLRDGKGLHVLVGQLVNDQFPPHPGTIDEKTSLLRFDLRDIASLRMDRISQSLQKKVTNGIPIDTKDVAELLTNCCGDILSGDFSLFEAASRIVKKRAKRLAREYPRRTRSHGDSAT
jgi:hypothetical protein